MAFVLIHHGWTNTRQRDHWQHHLAVALRLQGHQVSYAQYPDTQLPNFAAWSALLIAELEQLVELRGAMGGGEDIVFVGHSLGCVNFMKSALTGLIRPELKVDRAIFVAPASIETLGQVDSFQFDIESSGAAAVVRTALSAAAGNIKLLASDDDEWLPRGISATYGEPLGIEPVIIEGAKHLALSDGWGRWQGIIDWVNDPAANLTER